MKYYHLKSILGSNKKTFEINTPQESFFISPQRKKPYIEPTFNKFLFDGERPAIVLVSAIGATGKTALAETLSNQLGLPLLDLAVHGPVAGDSLTGLITKTFGTIHLSDILTSLEKGEYGIIIDGIDEGRSKTKRDAFEGFLDNIADLCCQSTTTTFLLLGRTHILEECWSYFVDKKIEAGLITIEPFASEDAKKYIDEYVQLSVEEKRDIYRQARDFILDILSKAFSDNDPTEGGSFLKFIGYPPVLDAIATLLSEEHNHYKLLTSLNKDEGSDVEISLLDQICAYIFDREKFEKVIPNITIPIMDQLPGDLRQITKESIYSADEQSARLVMVTLRKPLILNQIDDKLLNEKYEESIETFIKEHPFLEGTKFRNAIFESIVLATLIASGKNDFREMAIDYSNSNPSSYHLVYLLEKKLGSEKLPIKCLAIVLEAAQEFLSTNASVDIFVEADDNLKIKAEGAITNIETTIEIQLDKENKESRSFEFNTNMSEEVLLIGKRLASANVIVPCDVLITGASEIELIAPINISAKNINLVADSLNVLPAHQKDKDGDVKGGVVYLEGLALSTSLNNVSSTNVDLIFSLEEYSGHSYPVVQYIQKKSDDDLPQDMVEKYHSMRRILLTFRGHGRGTIAKSVSKIEGKRVLKSEVASTVLERLLSSGVLNKKEGFYYLDTEVMAKQLGASWHDFSKKVVTEKLKKYLIEI